MGWASFPWSRNAYEAVCAEETIELADIALYRAKAGGRNQGVGIVPGDSALAAPHRITIDALQNDKDGLIRIVNVKNPCENIETVSTNFVAGEKNPSSH